MRKEEDKIQKSILKSKKISESLRDTRNKKGRFNILDE
jgi:hypothetical protein